MGYSVNLLTNWGLPHSRFLLRMKILAKLKSSNILSYEFALSWYLIASIIFYCNKCQLWCYQAVMELRDYLVAIWIMALHSQLPFPADCIPKLRWKTCHLQGKGVTVGLVGIMLQFSIIILFWISRKISSLCSILFPWCLWFYQCSPFTSKTHEITRDSWDQYCTRYKASQIKIVMDFNVANQANCEIKILATITSYTVNQWPKQWPGWYLFLLFIHSYCLASYM